MLVNNIISKAKYPNEKAERLIVKMQKYRKFFLMNMFIISNINKILQRLTRKIPQIDISIQQQKLFLNYRQNWKTLFYVYTYI